MPSACFGAIKLNRVGAHIQFDAAEGAEFHALWCLPGSAWIARTIDWKHIGAAWDCCWPREFQAEPEPAHRDGAGHSDA